MFSAQKNPSADGEDAAFDIHKDLFIINEFTDLEPGGSLGCVKNPKLLNTRMFGRANSSYCSSGPNRHEN